MSAQAIGRGGDPICLGYAGIRVSVGDHVGHFYRTREEWASVAIPFVKTGLEVGDKCIYLMGSPRELQTFQRQLEAEGVAVDAATSRGQLDLREAPGNLEGFRDLLDDVAAEVPSRFPLMRLGGDMTWSLRKMPSCERLMELEARCNRITEPPGMFLCQYDLKSFMGHAIMDAMHTHRLCIVGRTLHTSPLYQDPAVLH